ncbi:hypothetical protein [Pontibacillus salipaludis]|uniref:Uncharacterized protein n=1 Tax=Pontibacillus salipaludis TaxID=1697394 RepID=A0ABQ1PWR8_9BACI|nr:hypothetical protein [Pontibacillus salipaludis]GGD05337.1 hypothetical protein GCM10011389_11050 [Pontibacillus salipaludis]
MNVKTTKINIDRSERNEEPGYLDRLVMKRLRKLEKAKMDVRVVIENEEQELREKRRELLDIDKEMKEMQDFLSK